MSANPTKLAPIVLDDHRAFKKLDIPVLSEGGYSVEFSNRGDKPHYNPSPANMAGEDPFRCILKEPPHNCQETSKRIDGLCRLHAPKKGRRVVLRKHRADWIGRMITPGRTREKCIAWAPAHGKMIDILIDWMDTDKNKHDLIEAFILDIMNGVKGEVPDSTALQDDLDRSGGIEAKHVAETALEMVDARFPASQYESVKINGRTRKYKYKHKEEPQVELKDIPLRVVAALLILGVMSEEANRSDLWGYTRIRKPNSSKRASVYMPLAYYFLRTRYGATKNQAAQSVRH